MKLSDLTTTLPFIGERYAQLLSKSLGIQTLRDLLFHFPIRYDNFSTIVSVKDIRPGATVTVIGTIGYFRQRFTSKKNFTIQEATLQDTSGSLKLLWFNQPYLSKSLRPGLLLSVAGRVESEEGRAVMKNPEQELVRGTPLVHTGRLVPVYPETRGVSSKWLRSRIAPLVIPEYNHETHRLLEEIREWLPEEALRHELLINLPLALQYIHFPPDDAAVQQARERLGFDELVLLQLEALLRKQQWESRGSAKAIKVNQQALEEFIKSLPFTLTADQRRAITEIIIDLKKTTPMNRLLQGDVGSGKTVIAAAAAHAAMKAGHQVAFMAPTQVLADQHAITLTTFLSPFGYRISLLTGATSAKRKRAKDTEYPDLIIGTHALLHQRGRDLIDKDRLHLIVIDEQHRFGVAQRAQLISQGTNTHVLSMTATPIPRTIALTLYADLSISVITQMPMGRLPVKTWVVSEKKRPAAYAWIDDQLSSGNQAFIICPLIEGSQSESLQAVKAATAEFESIRQQFPKRKIALLHGKLPPAQKSQILSQMKAREFDVLVATPVVEVGVDIPHATVIVIEGAERFGLAQLHQLRGRVGRRQKQSFCLLFTSSDRYSKRMKYLETIYNGLELAELDFRLRGPGEIFNTTQHGWPQFAFAKINDLQEVRRAHTRASWLLQKQDQYLSIKERINLLLDKSIAPN